jgi:hypothetical protein
MSPACGRAAVLAEDEGGEADEVGEAGDDGEEAVAAAATAAAAAAGGTPPPNGCCFCWFESCGVVSPGAAVAVVSADTGAFLNALMAVIMVRTLPHFDSFSFTVRRRAMDNPMAVGAAAEDEADVSRAAASWPWPRICDAVNFCERAWRFMAMRCY